MYDGRPVGGASLLFHLLHLFSLIWSMVWLIVTITLLGIKGAKLPFTPGALPIEIISSVLVIVVNFVGCSFAKAGNLTEEIKTIAISLAFFVVAIGGIVYFMWFQSYVMILDLALSAVFLGVNGILVFSGVWAIHQASIQALAPSYLVAKSSGAHESKKEK